MSEPTSRPSTPCPGSSSTATAPSRCTSRSRSTSSTPSTPGAVPTGTLFQNEVDLAASLGLSRPTMRRAMQHLVDKGLVVRRRGIGTRVVQPKLRRPLELTSLYDDLARAGQARPPRSCPSATSRRSSDVAERLEVGGGTRARADPAAQGRRGADRQADQLPARARGRLRADELAEHGLYELIRRQGVALHSADPDPRGPQRDRGRGQALGETRGAALVTAQRVTYDDHGAAVEFGTHLYAASRYTFEINLLDDLTPGRLTGGQEASGCLVMLWWCAPGCASGSSGSAWPRRSRRCRSRRGGRRPRRASCRSPARERGRAVPTGLATHAELVTDGRDGEHRPTGGGVCVHASQFPPVPSIRPMTKSRVTHALAS